MNKQIEIDGDTWEILGVGVTREEDGKTFVHLKSTTRGRQQRNGWVPVQIGDWISLPVEG